MFAQRLRTIPMVCMVLLIQSACNVSTSMPDVNAISTSVVGTVLAKLPSTSDASAISTSAAATVLAQLPSTPDANAISTSAVATVLAQLTQAAPPTSTPAPATSTPPPTYTPTLVTPSPSETPGVTATSSDKTLTASIPTNCREGPTSDYPMVGFLKVGQTATILGRDSTSSWWYIQNPTNTATGCWIWGATTKASGNTAELPVFTPPPPPPSPTPSTANYTLGLSTVRTCSGNKTAIITISNTMGSAFESASVKSTDTTSNTGLADYQSDTPFTNSANGCNGTETTLAGGDTMYIPISLKSAAAGHDIKVNVTLCTKDGLKGICVTNSINFGVP